MAWTSLQFSRLQVYPDIAEGVNAVRTLLQSIENYEEEDADFLELLECGEIDSACFVVVVESGAYPFVLGGTVEERQAMVAELGDRLLQPPQRQLH